jgi:type I restriction enzyme S subunit
LFTERIEKGYPDKPLLVASQNMGVVPKNIYGSRTVEALKDLHLLKLVNKGDFVISLRSFQGGIEYAHYEGIISPAYTVMVPNNDINPYYYKYLFKTIDFISLLKNTVTGIREGQNIDYQRLKNHLMPIPPRPEQDQIVRFLDWKVSLINKYLSAKQKQIALLREQKQAIINQAVTKGLNPNAPMKDSGVEWLGRIPEHWRILKLKRCASMQSGDNLTSQDIDNEGNYPVYGGNGLRGYYKKYNHSDQCLLVGRQGALCGNVHKVSGKFWATDHAIITIVYPDIHITWYYYLLLFMNLNQYSEAAAQPGLSVEKIQNLKTAVPPYNEQIQIADFIERKVIANDDYILRVNKEVELLAEYRARLISDVVSSRVDVRGVMVPDYEAVEETTNTVDEDSEEMEGKEQ